MARYKRETSTDNKKKNEKKKKPEESLKTVELFSWHRETNFTLKFSLQNITQNINNARAL